MKISDCTKLAIRNLSSNKISNLITMIVLFVLDLFLVFFIAVGVNVRHHIKTSAADAIKNEGISVSYNNTDIGGVRVSDLDKIKEIAGSEYDTVLYHNLSSTCTVMDLEYSKVNIITDTPFSEFKTNPYIILSESYKNEYKIDDVFVYRYNFFIVKGYTTDYYDMIYDLEYYINSNNGILYVTLGYVDNNKDDYNDVLKYFTHIKNEMRKTFTKERDLVVVSKVFDLLYDMYELANYIFLMLIGISIALFVLSISTIKKGIRIALDSDIYRIRMLKLCGANNKNIFVIYMLEIAMVVFTTITLATIISFFLKEPINNVSFIYADEAIHMFLDGVSVSKSNFIFPIYIPLLSFVITMVFVIISSWTSYSSRIVKDKEMIITGGGMHV